MLLLEDESLVHILPDLWPLLLPRNLPNKIADRPKELGSDILSRQVTPPCAGVKRARAFATPLRSWSTRPSLSVCRSCSGSGDAQASASVRRHDPGSWRRTFDLAWRRLPRKQSRQHVAGKGRRATDIFI
eukprot:Tamp_18722.p3 GENE.Tamp_18722~~Tamp_18722.p3  ORF type:complete len:130 (-),score=2.39 Tamp_18722:700-1089(-)